MSVSVDVSPAAAREAMAAGNDAGGRSRKRKWGDDTSLERSLPSPSPAPLPSTSSSHPSSADSVRGKPLEASSLAYFRSLHSSLQAAADGGEDVQLMVAAAYGELRGLEYRLLVNKHGSRCMEALIAHSTSSQLASLLSATHTAAFALLIDRNASHAMQRLIDRLPQMLMNEQRAGKQDEAGSLSTAVLSFCQSLAAPPSAEQSVAALSQSPLSASPSSCWPLLMLQEQGSFAVRSLARLMSGAAHSVTQQPTDGRYTATAARSGPAVPPASVSHVAFLRPVLAALVNSVVELKEADCIELAFHPTAAPALYELLVALSTHSHFHSLLHSAVLALLLTPMPTSATGADEASHGAISVSSRGVSHCAQLVRHRVGSHLFEHVLRAARHLSAPPGAAAAASTHFTFATLVHDTLQGDIAELAMHSTGNHVLQTALSLCTLSDQPFIKKAGSAIGAMFQALIESNRVGVIWRLLQASAFLSQTRRDRLFRQLQQSLQAQDSSQLLHALLTINSVHGTTASDSLHEMDETDVKQAVTPAAAATPFTAAAGSSQQSVSDRSAASSSSSSSSSPRFSLWSPPRRVSYLGSLLLQSLLSVPLSDSSLSAAVVSLPTDSLYGLACDGSGGPVVECILRVHSASSFSHPLSTQQRLIDALLPRVSELATSASGSYVVERMFGASDVRRKRAIAEALAKDEKRLKHSKPAAMLLRRCRLGSSKGSDKAWMAAEGARKRKAELFSDILNG